MNWFWNQWYYGSGQPKVEIKYYYHEEDKKVSVYIKQIQPEDKVFKLPIAIDVYTGSAKKRYNVWMNNRLDSFAFSSNIKPDLVNVDADKVLLWDKKDIKTSDDFIFQYQHAPNYLDRKEALDYFAKNNMQELQLGLNDAFSGLRKLSIDELGKSKFAEDKKILSEIALIADNEKDKKTKAAALLFLANTMDSQYQPIYTKLIEDSSYSVAGAALEGLSSLMPAQSYQLAKKYSSDAKGVLGEVVSAILLANGTEDDFTFIADRYNDAPASQDKLQMTIAFCDYLIKVTDVKKVKQGIDYIIEFRNFIPEQYRSFTDANFKKGLDKISKSKPGVVAEYITQVFK